MYYCLMYVLTQQLAKLCVNVAKRQLTRWLICVEYVTIEATLVLCADWQSCKVIDRWKYGGQKILRRKSRGGIWRECSVSKASEYEASKKW
jgi:hypothetical protein